MKIDNRLWDDIYLARDGIYGALGTIIFGALTADFISGQVPFDGWLPEGYEITLPGRIVIGIVIIMLFLYSSATLYAHRQVFMNVRSLRQEICKRGYRGLILMPSRSSHQFTILPDKDNFLEVQGICLTGTSLEHDIEAVTPARWNWQQLLRCIKPHIHTLEAVYVIGSKDTEEPDPKTGQMTKKLGSHTAIDDVKAIIARYCNKKPWIKPDREPVDFENFNDLQAAILRGIKEISQEHGIDESDIIIDVTGGQKTASIAGAVVTLNRSVAFQYVQTNSPYDVWEYDLAMRTPVSA